MALLLGVGADEPVVDWERLLVCVRLDVCEGVRPRAEGVDDALGVAAPLAVDVALAVAACDPVADCEPVDVSVGVADPEGVARCDGVDDDVGDGLRVWDCEAPSEIVCVGVGS